MFKINNRSTRCCSGIVRTPPPKLMEMGGLKIFTRKGGVRQNGGGVCLEMGGGGCHITLRFFWRFLMMHHRKKSLCVYLSFVNKNAQQNNCVNKIDDWHCKFLEMGGGYPKWRGLFLKWGVFTPLRTMFWCLYC